MERSDSLGTDADAIESTSMTVRTWITISVAALVALSVAVVLQFVRPVPAPAIIVHAGDVRLDGALDECVLAAAEREVAVHRREGRCDPRRRSTATARSGSCSRIRASRRTGKIRIDDARGERVLVLGLEADPPLRPRARRLHVRPRRATTGRSLRALRLRAEGDVLGIVKQISRARAVARERNVSRLSSRRPGAPPDSTSANFSATVASTPFTSTGAGQPAAGEVHTGRRELQVAEPVASRDVRFERAVADTHVRGRQPDEIVHRPGRSRGRLDAERQVRSRRSEDVAAVEGRRQYRAPVRLLGELERRHDAAAADRPPGRRGRCPDRRASTRSRTRSRPDDARVPTPGSTTARWTAAHRRLGQALREDDRTAADPADAVRDVDHPDVRCDTRDHQMTDTDELVRRAVIRGEGDERAHGDAQRYRRRTLSSRAKRRSAPACAISCAAAPSASSSEASCASSCASSCGAS